MAQGIDFTGLIRGQQMADNANWANIRRIQDQDTYAIQREEQLAKQQQQRQGREASTYLSTILPNLQRYADQGLNPVDALINQRAAIQNDQAYQRMSPEVQTQILNGLGQTASLHMQALAKAGDHTNLQRLVSTFGGTNPINPLGAAVASSDPTSIFNAVKARGAAIELVDGNVVDTATGSKVPLTEWAAYVAAGAGETNSAAGGLSAFQAQGQQDRALTAAEAQQKQSDTYQAALALQSGMAPAVVMAIFGAADPAVFTAGAPVIPGAAAGPTIATPEQMAALNTPIVPGAAAGPTVATPEQMAALSTPIVPGAATPGAATPVSPAIQQLTALIETANEPLLNNMQQTLQQKLVEGQQQLKPLNDYALSLERRQAIIERQLASSSGRDAINYLSPAERQALKGEAQQIRQLLADVEAKSAPLAATFKDMRKMFDSINVRRARLKAPQYGAAPETVVPDWATAVLNAQGGVPK